MSFREIIGHNGPVEALKGFLMNKQLGLSYLFYGPSGVGKAFVAKQFAKSLNCEGLKGYDCCDRCNNCRRADMLHYPDLHWLDLEGASDSIKIEQVRSLQNEAALRPFEGRAKVFIVNNCQSLTAEASSCLLKILEEPPGDSVIILVATDLRLLLPTIVSRCRKIRFSSLRRQEVEEILKNTHKLEGLKSHYLAYYLDGSLGAALSLSKSNFLSEKNMVLDKFLGSVGFRDAEGLFSDKSESRNVLLVLISWFRDLLYLNMNLDRQALINQDRIGEMKTAASRYSVSELVAILGHLSKGFEYLDKNVNLKLLADSLKVKIWKSSYR